ncbi:MAG TPA: phospholipase [Thermoanaerobaculia bacterium]
MITRRAAIQIGLGALAAACSSTEPDIRSGRIEVRPVAGSAPLPPGLHSLKLEREALLYIPERHRGAFALMLHGAGGTPERILRRFTSQADEFAVALFATKSEGLTWDAIRGDLGTDLLFLRNALRAAFENCAVDPAHLAISGFSDGASYALSLGVANGDLFSHVMAFSPGFLIPMDRVGKARIFLRTARTIRSCRSIMPAGRLRAIFDGPVFRSRSVNSTASTRFRPRWRARLFGG